MKTPQQVVSEAVRTVQSRGKPDVLAAIDNGRLTICVASPKAVKFKGGHMLLVGVSEARTRELYEACREALGLCADVNGPGAKEG